MIAVSVYSFTPHTSQSRFVKGAPIAARRLTIIILAQQQQCQYRAEKVEEEADQTREAQVWPNHHRYPEHGIGILSQPSIKVEKTVKEEDIVDDDDRHHDDSRKRTRRWLTSMYLVNNGRTRFSFCYTL